MISHGTPETRLVDSILALNVSYVFMMSLPGCHWVVICKPREKSPNPPALSDAVIMMLCRRWVYRGRFLSSIVFRMARNLDFSHTLLVSRSLKT